MQRLEKTIWAIEGKISGELEYKHVFRDSNIKMRTFCINPAVRTMVMGMNGRGVMKDRQTKKNPSMEASSPTTLPLGRWNAYVANRCRSSRLGFNPHCTILNDLITSINYSPSGSDEINYYYHYCHGACSLSWQ